MNFELITFQFSKKAHYFFYIQKLHLSFTYKLCQGCLYTLISVKLFFTVIFIFLSSFILNLPLNFIKVI